LQWEDYSGPRSLLSEKERGKMLGKREIGEKKK